MSALSRDLIVFFSVLTSAVFLWRFIRDKNLSMLSINRLGPGLKVLLAIIVPVCGLLYLSDSVGLQLSGAAPYFAGAAALACVLNQIGLPPFLRALVLLGGSVAFTCLVPADNYQLPLAAVMGGLVSWKAAENLLVEENSTLEDFLPSFLWLVGMYWTKTIDTGIWVAQHQNLLIGTFIVAIFMRWIQDPFLKEDKLYVKRLCLATIGGLLLLCIVTKLIVAMELAKICVIVGAGFFLTYLLQAMDKACENDSFAVKSFKQLLFIGIFTLLATRLFLTPGLLVLAVATLIATTSGAAAIAGMYWGSYVFLQTFIFKFNSNMTGINVMHPYTSAALYAGLLIAITACLLIRERMDNRARALLFIAASLIAPAATNFFLHSEPTASLLLAVLVGAVLIGIFSRALSSADYQGYHNVMLVPAQMISVGLLTGGLIELGNNTDSQERLYALVGLAVVSTVVLAIASFLSRQNKDDFVAAAPAGAVEPVKPQVEFFDSEAEKVHAQEKKD